MKKLYDLEVLTERFIEDIELVFEYYGIDDYVDYGDRIKLCCPIHNGDSSDSLVIWKNTGHWKCYSNHCEKIQIDDKTCGANVCGLVRGIEYKEGKILGYGQAIEKIRSILGLDGLVEHDKESAEMRDFIRFMKILNRKDYKHINRVPRKQIRKFLKIPALYYINRGFSPDILDKFDVGFCPSIKSEMFNRVAVPVYKDDYLIGCIGRCTNDNITPKWKNLHKFRSEHYLYNIWNAKEEIKKTETAILVEGQGDVWKCEEANIKNVLGLFGDSLTDGQRKLLEKTGAINIVIATDNDLAGLNARETIRKSLENIYNVYDATPSKKDWGEMKSNQVKKEINSVLDKIK